MATVTNAEKLFPTRNDLSEDVREQIDGQVREARARLVTINRRMHDLQREARREHCDHSSGEKSEIIIAHPGP